MFQPTEPPAQGSMETFYLDFLCVSTFTCILLFSYILSDIKYNLNIKSETDILSQFLNLNIADVPQVKMALALAFPVFVLRLLFPC